MNADVRQGEVWSPAQRRKNDVLYFAATAALAIATRLPLVVLRAFARALAIGVWAFVPNLRRVALSNVARTLDVEPHLFVRRNYLALGDVLAETVRGLHTPLPPIPFLPGARECLRAALAEGRGVLFASAHLGPWERVARTIGGEFPLTIVTRAPYDPRFAKLFHRLRDGIPSIERSSGAIRLARVLSRERGLLGIPMDLRTRVPSVDAPFLGIPAPTPIGPARLAVMTDAVVVVGTIDRADDGSLGISFTRLDGPHVDAAASTARINEELGRRIRRLPELWPWMHERFERDRV